MGRRFVFSQQTVSLIQKLTKLPEEVAIKITWGAGPRESTKHTKYFVIYTKAIELTRLSKELQIELIKEIEEKRLTVEQVKREVDGLLDKKKRAPKILWTRLFCDRSIVAGGLQQAEYEVQIRTDPMVPILS